MAIDADNLILSWQRAFRLDAKLSTTGETFKSRAESLGIEFKRTEARAQKARHCKQSEEKASLVRNEGQNPMTDNRNYGAFKNTAVYYVREAEIEIGKIGDHGLVCKCACHPALEPFVRRLGHEQFAKGKGVSKQALKAALEGTLEEAKKGTGRDGGQFALEFIEALSQVVVDV